jgi:hypothetical protein
VEEEDVGDRVDPSLGQHHTHGEEHIVDGDGSLGVEGLSHTLHSKSEDILVAKEGNTAQVLARQEGFVESEDQVSGPVVEKGGKGVGEALGNQCLLEDVQREIVTSERKIRRKVKVGHRKYIVNLMLLFLGLRVFLKNGLIKPGLFLFPRVGLWTQLVIWAGLWVMGWTIVILFLWWRLGEVFVAILETSLRIRTSVPKIQA